MVLVVFQFYSVVLGNLSVWSVKRKRVKNRRVTFTRSGMSDCHVHFTMYTLLFLVLCSAYPCENGGTCIEVGNKALCRCPAAFVGTFCEGGNAFQCFFLCSDLTYVCVGVLTPFVVDAR